MLTRSINQAKLEAWAWFWDCFTAGYCSILIFNFLFNWHAFQSINTLPIIVRSCWLILWDLFWSIEALELSPSPELLFGRLSVALVIELTARSLEKGIWGIEHHRGGVGKLGQRSVELCNHHRRSWSFSGQFCPFPLLMLSFRVQCTIACN